MVAADAGDGAADHAAVGQWDADVDGAEVACRPEQRLGGADDVLDLGQDRLDHRQPEDAGRQGAAGLLGQGRGARVDAGQARAQEAVPHAPLLEVVELDREAVLDLVGVVGDADAEALAQERADGALDEADEVVELDHRACRRGKRRVQERAGRVALAGEGLGALEGDVVEAPAGGARERGGGEVAGVERLQRMADEDAVAGAPLGHLHRAVDGVEELTHRDRGGARRVRALVVAGEGHDQAVAGGEQGVEQELAVLGARVALAHVGVGEHEVVAIARGAAGEALVVEPEQADDAVRHRAHRHERADGQVAGAEVGPGRAPLQALGQEGADLGERQRDAVVGADARVVGDVPEDALQLRALPVVARRGVGEGVGGVGQGGRPGIDGLGVGERIDGAVEAVDELGEPAGEVDGAALDVVEWQDLGELAAAVLGHGHADQQAVDALAPGARVEGLEPERLAVRVVQAPANAAGAHPLDEPGEVVVVEAEAPADGLAVGQVEDLRGGQAAGREVEDLGDDAEDRVGLAQGAVGELDAKIGLAALRPRRPLRPRRRRPSRRSPG